jgi:hypothetical protein
MPIVRAKGQVDKDRDDTLSRIEKANPTFRRHVDDAVIDVQLFPEHRVAVARTLLPTTDSSGAAPVAASFRNLQVFLKRGDTWECVAWQVTKVQE